MEAGPGGEGAGLGPEIPGEEGSVGGEEGVLPMEQVMGAGVPEVPLMAMGRIMGAEQGDMGQQEGWGAMGMPAVHGTEEF